MQHLKKILVVIDPTSESQRALERAVLIARATGAQLELFICYYDSVLSGKPFFDDRSLRKSRKSAIEHRLQELERLASPLEKEGLSVSIDARWDHPLDEGIVRKAQESEPDLLVKDTHHHPVLKRTLFSNTDWNLIRACPVPLLLVKPGRWAAQPKILAAVDPSHIADKPASLDHDIVAAGEFLSGSLGGELHVFHAFLPISAAMAGAALAAVPLATGAVVEDYGNDMEAIHRAEVARVLQTHDVHDDRTHLVEGSAVDVLPAFAQENSFDLVVMGAVARSRIERVFIGSTAESVLDHLPCDVLIVKPRGFVSPLQK